MFSRYGYNHQKPVNMSADQLTEVQYSLSLTVPAHPLLQFLPQSGVPVF
jgi:hypothetical protein